MRHRSRVGHLLFCSHRGGVVALSFQYWGLVKVRIGRSRFLLFNLRAWLALSSPLVNSIGVPMGGFGLNHPLEMAVTIAMVEMAQNEGRQAQFNG